MDTQLSEDQHLLEDACEKLLEKEWPLENAMKALGPDDGGHSSALWKTFAENGWLALPFPEELGGAGASLNELGLVYRAAGRRLVPSTFYSCLFAELLIHQLGTQAQAAEYLPDIFAGRRLATVAYSEPQAAEASNIFTTTASRVGDTWILKGVKAFVPNVDTADFILVLAKVQTYIDRGGWGLFVVAADQVSNTRRQSTFGGEHLFELSFDGVSVSLNAQLGGEVARTTTLDGFEDVVEKACALQCMEMAGGIKEVLDRTVAYVSERVVLGRPIGSYQAVQHMLADIFIELNGARLAALQALSLKSKGLPAAREIAIAKMALGETYTNATVIAHEVWGAMGYARETGLYLWSERAKVTDAWFGTRPMHLRRLQAEMGL